MAKILVADDNSNIQRMVGLALKDQGIEVVAVGNGEAAVRKITEIHPDLVLADVFMPVRNGYEVCQFVKQNPALAHIPVILLIGAFDPLDEQEAQRVGSDGVLKKPFVPPDPLITMVKNALQKAGVSLSGAGSQKSASSPRKSEEASKSSSPETRTEPAKPSSPLAGLKFSRFTSAEPPAPVEPPSPVLQEMSFVEEPAPPPPVTIAPSDNIMAFENLLGGATTEEPAEKPQLVTSPVQAAPEAEAEESVDVPEEPEESEPIEDSAAPPSWRRDPAEETFADDETVGAVKDWRDSEVLQTVGRRNPLDSWDQNETPSGFGGAQRVPEEVPAELGAFTSELSALETESRSSNSIAAAVEEVSATSLSATPQAPSPGMADEFGRPEELAVEALGSETEPAVGEVSAQTAEPPIPAAEEQRAASSHEVAPEEAQLHDVLHELEQAKHQPAPVEEKVEHLTAEQSPEREPVNSWFSRPVSPWDTEPHRPNPLAAAWGASKATAVAEPETKQEQEPEPVAAANEPTAHHSEEPPQSHGTNGQSTSHDIEELIAAEPAAQETAAAPTQDAAATSAQANVDDLVARVLARMNPDVLQAVTREILKPMVAAILAEESKRKD